MVQFFKGSADPRDAAWGQFASALGEGLGKGLNTYHANKALQEVLDDESLKDAPLSKKMGFLHKALSPYGEVGQQVFQNQLATEQQEQQEKQEKLNLKKGEAFRKRLAGEPISEKEQAMFTPEEELAIAKHLQTGEIAKNKALNPKVPAAEKPIPKDQQDAIDNVRSRSDYNDMNETEKYNSLLKAGVSPSNAQKEAELFNKQETRQDQKVKAAYDAQKDFIDDTTSSYRGFESEMKPRLLQMQHMDPKDIVSPTAAVFLETLGIPLGALEDPSSELYNKLSQDLLKGLPETYGSRILKVEVDNFLKTIPTLLNSPDGRRMIASNMLKLGEMKEVYYNAMRGEQRKYLDENKPLPRDFQQVVFDQVKPQIDRINNEFIKMADVKSVPEGTVPFFSPSGEIEFIPQEHIQWATDNGGRRIW
jgi:hypothetical protein